MTTLRYAVRALALSLTLTAAGAMLVGAPAFPESTATSIPATSPTGIPATSPASEPVGGQQLAARGVIVNLKPGVPPPPVMKGASFVLADMDTGEILVAKAPHAHHLTASTMKSLTALTLIPLLSPNRMVMVKPEDVTVTGTHVGIVPGTQYSTGMLLKGLLLSSGNDAAYALARSNQSMAVTLQEMNATAADLHADDTVARDPSGLEKGDQHSSAYDLALIGRAGMRLPDFRNYVMTKQASFRGKSAAGAWTRGFAIQNHNKLLFNYPGTIGVKNGYTIAAQHTFIGAATRGGKTYIMAEMASPDARWQPTAALLTWAFRYGTSVTPVGALVEPGEPVVPKPTVTAAALPAMPPSHVPRELASQPGLPTWIGTAGGMSALALIGLWAWRNIFRRPRAHTARH